MKNSSVRRSALFVLFSVILFILAIISAEYQAIFISLSLAVFGGFMMLISTMIREKSHSRVEDKEEDIFA
ncbi:MAG: hypothetical protein M1368_02470 [Thaumarchaeota archaeon]|nr:hypothetical protein [Nitrososphaerota archaeon]